jgi:transcriptional regulator with GAF, ATPase, and Fis domain
VPQALMAAPLLFGGECVGVLEVLDWTEGSRSELEDLRLLSVIADQAAAAVWMLARLDPLTDGFADPRARQLCARIMQALSGFSGPELERRISLVDSLAQMLDE